MKEGCIILSAWPATLHVGKRATSCRRRLRYAYSSASLQRMRSQSNAARGLSPAEAAGGRRAVIHLARRAAAGELAVATATPGNAVELGGHVLMPGWPWLHGCPAALHAFATATLVPRLLEEHGVTP